VKSEEEKQKLKMTMLPQFFIFYIFPLLDFNVSFHFSPFTFHYYFYD